MVRAVFQVIVFSFFLSLATESALVAATYHNMSKSQVHRLAGRQNDVPSEQVVAHWLNWVPQQGACSLCAGHFVIAPTLLANPNPKPMNVLPTTVTSQGPSLLEENGVSVLKKKVVVTQKGRLAHSDLAYVHYNNHLGKVEKIRMLGHVRLAESRRLVVGETGFLNFQHQHYQVHQGWYRFDAPSLKGDVHYWGRAEQLDHFKNGDTVVKNGSISSCAPIRPFWQMRGQHFLYSRQRHFLYGRGGSLLIKGLPVLYTPYFWFPVGDKRRSGWLMPRWDDRSLNGVGFGVPYYWNLAPNYDALVTPTWWTRRGLQLGAQFRYLGLDSQGSLNVSGILDHGFDRERARLKQNAEQSGAVYQDALNSIGQGRGAFRFQNKTVLSDTMLLNLNLNVVSDAYFLSDFSPQAVNTDSNQLVNELLLSDQLQRGQWALLFLGYQTLHQINLPAVYDQFYRLPELDYSSNFPNAWRNANVGWDSQFVNFAFSGGVTPAESQSVGLRWHARPYVIYLVQAGGVRILPQLYLDATAYQAQLPATPPGVARQHFDQGRLLPIFSVSAKRVLQRAFHWGARQFWQTLVPKIQYTFVPLTKQANDPNFDSATIPFSYSQVFSLNSFDGLDRLQNTSQMSLGLESQILRQTDGSPILTAGIGAVDYWQQRRVCLSTGCAPLSVGWSPVAGQLSFSPVSTVTSTLNAVWQPGFGLTTLGVSLQYSGDHQHQWISSWNEVKTIQKQGNGSYLQTADSGLISVGTVWPLLHHWSGFGYLQYNVSEKRPESYFFGIQYDSCCWALRILLQQRYIGTAIATSKLQFEHAYSVQLLLKGLGGVSSGAASTVLSSAFPGFEDPFKST